MCTLSSPLGYLRCNGIYHKQELEDKKKYLVNIEKTYFTKVLDTVTDLLSNEIIHCDKSTNEHWMDHLCSQMADFENIIREEIQTKDYFENKKKTESVRDPRVVRDEIFLNPCLLDTGRKSVQERLKALEEQVEIASKASSSNTPLKNKPNVLLKLSNCSMNFW